MKKINDANTFEELFSIIILDTLKNNGFDLNWLKNKLQVYLEKRYPDHYTLSNWMLNHIWDKFEHHTMGLAEFNHLLASMKCKMVYEIKSIIDQSIDTHEDKYPSYPPIWDQKIETLGLSMRAENAIKTESEHGPDNGRIDYIGHLVALSEKRVQDIPGIGGIGWAEISKALRQKGLWLGMDTSGWTAPVEPEPHTYPKIWDEPVDSLRALAGMPARCLIDNDVHYIGQLIAMHPNAIIKLPGIGSTTERKIHVALVEQGLKLGTQTGNWTPPKN